MLLSGDLVLWDSEVRLEDKKDIGQDLAILGELSHHKVEILPQIIVTPVAFHTFLKDNGLDTQIKHLLGTLNHERHDSLTQIASYAKKLIEHAPIHKDIHGPIHKKLSTLNAKSFTLSAFYFREGKQIESKKWEGISGEAVISELVREAWAALYSHEHLKKHTIHAVNFHTFSVVLSISPEYSMKPTGHIRTLTLTKGEFEIEAHTLVTYSYNKHLKKITGGKVLSQGGKEVLSVFDIKTLLSYAHALEKVVYLPYEMLWGKYENKFFVTSVRPLSQDLRANDTYNSLVESITVHPGITIGRLKVIDEKSQSAVVIDDEIVMVKKLDKKMLETIKRAKGIIIEEEPHPEIKTLLKSFGIPTVIRKNNRLLYSTGDVVSLNATTGEIKRGSMLVS